MKIDGSLYLHSSKDTSREFFIDACEWEDYKPSEESIQRATYAGYEVELSGYWDEEGNFYCTAIDNVPLREPVKI